MESRIYRQASCAAIVGAAILAVGGVITGLGALHLANGTPLMEGTSKFTSGVQPASASELWLGVIGGIPFMVLGLAMILSIVNVAVIVDDRGLRSRNLLRRTVFSAAWSEITSVASANTKQGMTYVVTANGKSLKLNGSLLGLEELLAEIERRRPADGGETHSPLGC